MAKGSPDPVELAPACPRYRRTGSTMQTGPLFVLQGAIQDRDRPFRAQIVVSFDCTQTLRVLSSAFDYTFAEASQQTLAQHATESSNLSLRLVAYRLNGIRYG